MKQLQQNRTDITPELPMQYSLLSTEGPDGLTAYGVSVTNLRSGETATLADLTTEAALAAEFFSRLSRGQVTPVSLQELAEDFLAEIL